MSNKFADKRYDRLAETDPEDWTEADIVFFAEYEAETCPDCAKKQPRIRRYRTAKGIWGFGLSGHKHGPGYRDWSFQFGPWVWTTEMGD